MFGRLSDTPTLERLNWRGGQGEKSTGLGMGIAEVSGSYWPGMKTLQTAPSTYNLGLLTSAGQSPMTPPSVRWHFYTLRSWRLISDESLHIGPAPDRADPR